MQRALAAPDKFGGIDRQLFELTVPRNGLGSSRAWTSLLAYPRSLWSKTRRPLPTRKAAAVTTGGRPIEENIVMSAQRSGKAIAEGLRFLGVSRVLDISAVGDQCCDL